MNKYLKAISYNFIFFILSTLAYLILTPLAIKIMGDEFFGLWSILFAIAQFTNIGTLGIGSIVNKFAAEKNDSRAEDTSILSSAVIIVLPMALVTLIILLICRNLIVNKIDPSLIYLDQFKYALTICAFSIIPQFINKVFQGYFLSQIKNKFVRTMDFITSIFPLAGAVLITTIEKNLVWISLWNFFIQLMTLIIFWLSITKIIKWKWWSPEKVTIKRMLHFSKFMFIETSSISLFQQFDRILVGLTLGPVIAGVYSVGTSIGLRMSMIAGQITEVMIPYASLKNSIGENDNLFSIFRKMSQYISMIVAVFGSLLIIWMQEILTVWISPEYAAKYSQIFSILIVAYGILGLCRPAHQTLQGIGQVKFTSILYFFSSVIMLLGVYILTQKFGFIGAAIANTMMTFLLFMNLRTYKILNGKLAWDQVIYDLKWGLLLPVLSFVYISHVPSLPLKYLFTLMLITLVMSEFLRDPFFRNQILQIIKSTTKAS